MNKTIIGLKLNAKQIVQNIEDFGNEYVEINADEQELFKQYEDLLKDINSHLMMVLENAKIQRNNSTNTPNDQLKQAVNTENCNLTPGSNSLSDIQSPILTTIKKKTCFKDFGSNQKSSQSTRISVRQKTPFKSFSNSLSNESVDYEDQTADDQLDEIATPTLNLSSLGQSLINKNVDSNNSFKSDDFILSEKLQSLSVKSQYNKENSNESGNSKSTISNPYSLQYSLNRDQDEEDSTLNFIPGNFVNTSQNARKKLFFD